jgi:hypothetical protein
MPETISQDAFIARVRTALETLATVYIAETGKDFTHWDLINEALPDGTGAVYYIRENPPRIWKDLDSKSSVYQFEQKFLEQLLDSNDLISGRPLKKQIVDDFIGRFHVKPSEAEIACFVNPLNQSWNIEVRPRSSKLLRVGALGEIL